MNMVHFKWHIVQIHFTLGMIKPNPQGICTGSFDLSQMKHVCTNAISLLNTAWLLVPEELDKWD